jgi:hypothetical protein
MFWLAIAILTVVLLIAPLRRAFLGAWRVTVPLVVGALGGLLLVEYLVAARGFPRWVVLFAVPLLAWAAIGAFGEMLAMAARHTNGRTPRRP